jgi:glycosyltransferase involved in cell wall biosynthesis
MKKINSIAIVWEQKEWGGVDSYLNYLINSKFFKEISITIFTNKNNKGLKRFIKNNINKKIKIIEYFSFLSISSKNNFVRKILYFLAPLFFVITFFQFKKIFYKKKFDVLIGQCGGFGSIRGELAALLAANKKYFILKTLVIHHASTFPPICFGNLVYLINFLLARTLSSVIFISEATKNTVFYKSNLLDRDNMQALIIQNGVPVFESNKFYTKSKKILDVAVISRIEEYKGHLDLVSAYDKLQKKYKDKLKFHFIGSGDDLILNNLKSFIESINASNNFIFHNYLDLNIEQILSDKDLILSLTRSFEGCGLTILEALSYGVPVMITNVGAISEYYNSNFCKIINSSSINDITKELMDFVDNNENWIIKAKAGKDYVRNTLNQDIMGNNYLMHFTQKINFSLNN